jgi:hypothetical protein
MRFSNIDRQSPSIGWLNEILASLLRAAAGNVDHDSRVGNIALVAGRSGVHGDFLPRLILKLAGGCRSTGKCRQRHNRRKRFNQAFHTIRHDHRRLAIDRRRPVRRRAGRGRPWIRRCTVTGGARHAAGDRLNLSKRRIRHRPSGRLHRTAVRRWPGRQRAEAAHARPRRRVHAELLNGRASVSPCARRRFIAANAVSRAYMASRSGGGRGACGGGINLDFSYVGSASGLRI